MKISIVIPVYNVEQYIEDCLLSVTTQTYTDEIECIIVNDCTQDNSCIIIDNFIKKYIGSIQFKFIHHLKNRGLSAARNSGIEVATGDYIYFLDSDDELTPNTLEVLSAPLEQIKYDFVIGDYLTNNSTIEFPPLLLKDGEISTNEEIRNSYFAGEWYVMAWNKLYNLNFIRKHSLLFKEGLLNEDNLWSFQCACLAQSIYVVKEQTYKYKVRETSIMGCLNSAKQADAFATITNEAYKWATLNGYIHNKNTFKKILYYREFALNLIFSLPTFNERKELYLQCYKRLRIDPWNVCRRKIIKPVSLIKELYNYLPGITGYWFLHIYNKLLEARRFFNNHP